MRRRRADRGAAAVEAALVLPVLLLIVFGIIDFGRMLNAQLTVNEAARETARAVSLGYDPAAAGSVADELGATWSIERSCAGGNEIARVTVAYRFEFVTPVAVLADLGGPITLSGRGVMPCRS